MTTHLALAVTTTTDSGTSIQSVIVPDYSTTQCLFRESTGSRGRGSAWQVSNITTVIKTQSGVGTDSTISAFLITDRDLAGLKAGIATIVGVKALASMDTSVLVSQTTHGEAITNINSAIVSGNNDYLVSFLASGVSLPSVMPLSQSALVSADTLSQKGLAPQPVNNAVTADTAQTAEGLEAPTFVQTVASVNTNIRMELATVPDSRWSAEYINRKVLGSLTEFDIYDQALADKANVLISGHAGSGKTMSVMAYASARNMRFYSVSAHAGIEVSQVFGKYNPTPEGKFAWTDGGLTDCVRNGNAVLLFNEVNFLPERFTTVIFSLLDARREITLMDKDGEVIKAGDNLLIIGDMNPNYRGTRQMNQAWKDRFSQHSIEFPYDPVIEAKLIPNKGLLEMANQLRIRFDKEEISTPISTRSLVAFHKNTLTLGIEYATYAYLNLFGDITERNAVRLVIEAHKSAIESGIK